MVAAPNTVTDHTVEETKSPQKEVTAEELKKDMAASGSKDVTADPDNSKKLEDASEKFAAGKKFLLQSQAQEAVDVFAEACRLMSSIHGDLSYEMCDYYYYYGRALLEVARIEEGVLGNALAGVPEADSLDDSQVEDPDKMTAEEKESVAQQVDEALKENFKSVEKSSSKSDKEQTKEDESKESEKEAKAEESKESEKESKEDSEKMETEEAKETKDGEEKEEEEEEEAEKEGDEEEVAEEEGEDAADDSADAESQEAETTQDEDVSSLQLAWEVLELAKTIYEKDEKRSKEDSKKLSQVYLKLGEVSLENENYPDSIHMYTDCLKLQESILEADDRWLAETHYQLGLAHSLSDNFDESVKHLEKAVGVIDCRIKNLTESLDKDSIKVSDDLDESKLSEEQKTKVSEVKDLQKLQPILQEKITDIKDTKANFTEKLKAMKNHLTGVLGGSSSSGFGESSSESSEAKPIATSLIRKKRKPEEEAAPEGTKKARTESTEESTESSKSNGAEEKMETDK